jgi:hypothetical protein
MLNHFATMSQGIRSIEVPLEKWSDPSQGNADFGQAPDFLGNCQSRANFAFLQSSEGQKSIIVQRNALSYIHAQASPQATVGIPALIGDNRQLSMCLQKILCSWN